MDCGTSLVKYILFLFNTLVSIIGILAIVYGVILLNSIGMVEVKSDFPPQAVLPIGLIALGSVVVFISFLGCCGAIRESVCMTMTYAVFLLILLIIQLTVVVLLFMNKDKLREAIGSVVDNAWESRDEGVFDALQKSLKCCGKTSPADYPLVGKIPPPSCCENNSCSLIPPNYYGGCRNKFQDLVTGGTENTKFAGIALIVVELIGFIFACCLANNVRNYKRRNAY